MFSACNGGPTKMYFNQLKRSFNPNRLWCPGFASASKSSPRQSDKLPYSRLRYIAAVFSPVGQVETTVMPLEIRRNRMILNYATGIWSYAKHRNFIILFGDIDSNAIEESNIELPAVTIREVQESSNVDFPPVFPRSLCKDPPWVVPGAKIIKNLSVYRKWGTDPLVTIAHHKEILEKLVIYTDGSENQMGVGSAIHFNNENHSWTLHNTAIQPNCMPFIKPFY
ncbi:hypothetical protein JTB14_032953 [Gonioctena quinquepunctata]|nr:hypothetical protein JTB14_032953 [Gonioctena quinquepunctata]